MFFIKEENIIKILAIVVFLLPCFSPVYADSPSGADTFELTASPFTGGDNTGDGGTGNPDDLNYYYVGQTFTNVMQIVSGTGSNGADLWIDYDLVYFTAFGLSTGSYYSNWTGQDISGGRVRSSAYNNPGNYSSGAGNYGDIDWTLLRPTVANYGTGSPQTLDINVGTIGETTESNISRDGLDILDDEEDFQLHIWADTRNPYALNPNPVNTASGVSIDINYLFDLRDSKNGEGDDTGVGTGMNTATPPGVITFNDGGGAISYTAYDSYNCSGVWGTNLCSVTINPPSPLGIPGDTRNWKYSTTYITDVSGFQDQASATQNQLGDTNGPNTMDAKSWTFTTEADTVAPRVTSESPVRGSVDAAVDTNIVIEVTDRKTYPGGPSGTGVSSLTCDINVSSATVPLITYAEGSAGVTVTAIDYGYRYAIDPASDFAQNEVVSVSVFNCQDNALIPNTIVTDNWTFTTSDTDPPYVDTLNPADNAIINVDGTVSFHIKDDGVGVDISAVVVYIDGTYYTNGGGAGSVTITGTRITYATSLDFNGGNYAGDTTSVAGTSADYTFILNPETDFAAGEVIPVLVYARDNSNNLMERNVSGLVSTGASCSGGDAYCGTDTSWDGTYCIGTGGSCASGDTYCGANTTWNGTSCVGNSGGSGGGGGSIAPPQIHSQSIIQIDESSVLVSWHSNRKGTSIVSYDTTSRLAEGEAPKFGYTYASEEFNDNSVYHSVVITGLESGRLYYFRPSTKISGEYVTGEEQKMAPQFSKVCEVCVPEKICDKNEICAEYQIATPITTPIKKKQPWQPQQPQQPQRIFKIKKVEGFGDKLKIWGEATPFVNIKITVF